MTRWDRIINEINFSVQAVPLELQNMGDQRLQDNRKMMEHKDPVLSGSVRKSRKKLDKKATSL